MQNIQGASIYEGTLKVNFRKWIWDFFSNESFKSLKHLHAYINSEEDHTKWINFFFGVTKYKFCATRILKQSAQKTWRCGKGIREDVGYYYKWNQHCADSILGQHLSIYKKFSAITHSTVSPTPKMSIAKGFRLLHFPLEEPYEWDRRTDRVVGKFLLL